MARSVVRKSYPEHHLLATSPEGDPVCPACVWDGDQHWRADLPYLAVQIDRLVDQDLSAPAGWAAVAVVLALTCGANLGRRLERELNQRGGWPIVMERWDQPMDQSWIWLLPRQERHPAFAHLGAGASLAAITQALERHDPTLPTQAQRLCRDAEVAWRPALLPAAVAYAVAFTTQAAERDRHRKPVHVVDSTRDGLSEIRTPSSPATRTTSNPGSKNSWNTCCSRCCWATACATSLVSHAVPTAPNPPTTARHGHGRTHASRTRSTGPIKSPSCSARSPASRTPR
ncbi:MAG: hypothetical protein JWN52_7335 [Actinomycetia bacterium]|nr:hypothetical protein [Actinomycetes bacterium]